MGAREAGRFLIDPAVNGRASAFMQNQARCALLSLENGVRHDYFEGKNSGEKYRVCPHFLKLAHSGLLDTGNPSRYHTLT
jgi:hypothetical protein